MRIRTRSKKRRALDAVGTYLKFKAIAKFAKGARKSAKGLVAYKATKSVAKKAPTPAKKALPVVAGVGVAGAVAARTRRHREATPA
jgi:hypothetical protein